MNINDIEQFRGKKVRIITSTRFTYVGYIESFGSDYIRFKDKYSQLKFITIKFINFIEEVAE